jgi:predicted nucleotidyltransferase component of viral defense system
MNLDDGGPRLLFKGCTSLSKGYGLIATFSEDIDITVFREEIGLAATVGGLETLTNRKETHSPSGRHQNSLPGIRSRPDVGFYCELSKRQN